METTLLTDPSPIAFGVAVKEGAAHLDEDNSLDMAIDIFEARERNIRPLDLGDRSFVPQQTGVTESPSEIALSQTSSISELASRYAASNSRLRSSLIASSKT